MFHRRYVSNTLPKTSPLRLYRPFLGPIGHRVEVRPVETNPKHASHDDGTVATQSDHHVVHVLAGAMQDARKCGFCANLFVVWYEIGNSSYNRACVRFFVCCVSTFPVHAAAQETQQPGEHHGRTPVESAL